MPINEAATAALDEAITAYTAGLIAATTNTAIRAHIIGDVLGHNALGLPVVEAVVQNEALLYAQSYRQLLVEKGASIIQGKEIPWLAEQTASTRSSIYQIIESGIAEGKPVADIGGKVGVPGTVAHDLEAYAIRQKNFEYVRIARTETGRIMNEGTLNRFDKSNITHVEVLDNEGPNSCEACAAINGQVWTVEYSRSHELEHPNCFIDAQVPIFTSNGWKQIGDIVIDELVLSHLGRFRKVTDTFKVPKQTVNVVKIGVGDSRTTRRIITVTDDHPIMLNGTWQSAKYATLDDYATILEKKCDLMDHDHEYVFLQMKVQSVQQYTPKQRKTLYNLSVNEDESFIAKGFVVHNCVRSFSPIVPDDWEPPE